MDALEVRGAVPNRVSLLLGQFAPGAVDGHPGAAGTQAELLFPLLRLVAPPGCDGVLVKGEPGIGTDQLGVDADGGPEALAARTRPDRVLEGEEFRGGFDERAPIDFETVIESDPLTGVRPNHIRRAPPFEKCRLQGVCEPGSGCRVRVHGEPVDDQFERGKPVERVGPAGQPTRLQQFIERNGVPFPQHPAEPLLPQEFQPVGSPLPRRPLHRRRHQEPPPLRMPPDPLRYIRRPVPLHLAPRHRIDRPPDAGKEEPEIILQLRPSPHRRARPPHRCSLLDGDGRRDAVDAIHIRLVQPAQKLPCVAAETLHIPALPLSEERIERQRALARARKSRDDRHLSLGDGDRYVLEVVNPSAPNANVHCISLTPESYVGF